MSDLFGNHIVGFSTRWPLCNTDSSKAVLLLLHVVLFVLCIELSNLSAV